jgi:hypothetical protein
MSNFLTVEQVTVMLDLQASMNDKVNPDWKTANYPWLRAALVESVEGIQHIGFKWWKKETSDIPQAQMELVDIWHFYLSHMLCWDTSGLASLIHTETKHPFITTIGLGHIGVIIVDITTLEKFDRIAGLAAFGEVDISLFGALLADLGMTWDNLFKMYIGKNALNGFRSRHGYKEGTYIKIWNGLEDNEVLHEILQKVDGEPKILFGMVDNALSIKYNQVLAPIQG